MKRRTAQPTNLTGDETFVRATKVSVGRNPAKVHRLRGALASSTLPCKPEKSTKNYLPVLSYNEGWIKHAEQKFLSRIRSASRRHSRQMRGGRA